MLQTNNKLKKIKGDASFRSFYRKLLSNKKSIVVFASKEKEKNLLIYDAINSLLIKNKVLAPKLYSENYKKNYIEIEDFGDDSVFSLLKKNKNQRETLYQKSVDLLSVIQKIKQNQCKNFKGKNYKIPIYNNVKLFNEANLFLVCSIYLLLLTPLIVKYLLFKSSLYSKNKSILLSTVFFIFSGHSTNVTISSLFSNKPIFFISL